MNGITTGKVVLRQLMYTTKKMRIHIYEIKVALVAGKYVKGDTLIN